eukprot:TRINITY_DN10844_c0_g1_i1.p2 TRINITY_DN10844_c0_g1~~TRINITY_DN10844_c0_g1_i1.p2  ORF type:complete len:137 (+),score=12.88 TRINITY_DN10844_c0_g1_i1:117-527(+)
MWRPSRRLLADYRFANRGGGYPRRQPSFFNVVMLSLTVGMTFSMMMRILSRRESEVYPGHHDFYGAGHASLGSPMIISPPSYGRPPPPSRAPYTTPPPDTPAAWDGHQWVPLQFGQQPPTPLPPQYQAKPPPVPHQ